MTNLLFVSYSSKISSNRVNVALPWFKPGQLHLAVGMVTSSVLSTTSKPCFEDFVSSICNLKTVF
ncbi:Uncharacterised protein [Streptococcus pneumoniae]|nr:Uncharacterised protein [Streptococcus pneumoniae]